MQKRMKLGKVDLPLWALLGYTASGGLIGVDMAVPFGDFGRVAIVAVLVGATSHILDKIDRTTAVVEEKIDGSVGDVWDAGQESGIRNERLKSASDSVTLAVVHDLAGR